MRWETSIIISLSIFLLFWQVILIVDRKHNRTTSAHKLTFIPYWLAISQMLAQIIYSMATMIAPETFVHDQECQPTASSECASNKLADIWSVLFLELTCLLCAGIIISILTVYRLLTALIKFQNETGVQRVQVLKDEHFNHER